MAGRVTRVGFGKLFITLAIGLLAIPLCSAGQWAVLGPDGGDVRSFAYDPSNPDHIYLGTSTGTLFSSTNGGQRWSRFAHLGNDDFVLDHIAVDHHDPQNIYVAAWSVENQQAGDLYHTRDGGKIWETIPAMHGKSIRAFSIADSDSRVLVAGALDGVFRSKDGGETWERISPASHNDIKNIESIAIDPQNPNVIYAGTWHLAWKTDDGGTNWRHINKGMIDDSDVFSIIVDSSNPAVVFASACSGIYRSQTSGDLFQKIQGIPFSARRTRVLKQDPKSPGVVYAGTTEGLWKTSDSGKTWRHVTNNEVVVNDVFIDPRDSNRVLLATDRGGVLASKDGAETFTSSNRGYTHRYVSSIVVDRKDPGTIVVGVVNDREWGGVFASHDGGLHWQQQSAGLDGRDVFALEQAPNGQLVAGTNRGIFVLDHNASAWRPANTIVNEKTILRTVKKGTKRVSVARKTVSRSVLASRVSEIEITPTHWLAATAAGLYTSTDQGKTWSGGPVLGKNELISVQERGNLLVTATRMHALVSKDGGATWVERSPSSYVTSIRGVTISGNGEILVASREGAFLSPDGGATWDHVVNGLPDKNISSIVFDEAGKRLLATSLSTGVVFESIDGRVWQRGPDSGYPLRRIGLVGRRLVAATPFDGVIAQPENDNETSAGLAGSSH